MSDAIEIKIPDVPLEKKLSIVGAALETIREAHRETMPVKSWRKIMEAEACIAEAMIGANGPIQLKL